MNISKVLDAIPYLRVHELSVDKTEDAVHVRMPAHKVVTNHVGIVHAGALFTLAETAAGVAAWDVVPNYESYVLLRGATISYTRRAEGEVVATARVDAADAVSAREAFAGTSRADAPVVVTIADSDGQTVFEGTFTYALRPRQSCPTPSSSMLAVALPPSL